MECPLCKALKTETPLASNKDFVILRTKKMKGHKERIMVVFRVHTAKLLSPSTMKGEAFLEEVGKKLFRKHTTFFIIMDSTYGSIKDHFHLVASDLDRNTEDYEQMLLTKWIKVVSVYDDLETSS